MTMGFLIQGEPLTGRAQVRGIRDCLFISQPGAGGLSP